MSTSLFIEKSILLHEAIQAKQNPLFFVYSSEKSNKNCQLLVIVQETWTLSEITASIYFLCVHVLGVGLHLCCMYRGQRTTWEMILSCHPMGPKDWTWVLMPEINSLTCWAISLVEKCEYVLLCNVNTYPMLLRWWPCSFACVLKKSCLISSFWDTCMTFHPWCRLTANLEMSYFTISILGRQTLSQTHMDTGSTIPMHVRYPCFVSKDLSSHLKK